MNLASILYKNPPVSNLSGFIFILYGWNSRLQQRLGWTPSDEQLATSLRISRTELQARLIESTLAREKLAMSNVRLVMSIAQRYDNMGAEMADLVQVFFPILKRDSCV